MNPATPNRRDWLGSYSRVAHWLPFLWLFAINLPGRWRFAFDEQRFGVPVIESLTGGLLADLAILPLPIVLLLAPMIYFATQQKKRDSRLLRGLLLVALVALLGASWVMSVAATETKMQLGFYPTVYEAHGGLGNSAFVSSSLVLILGGRYAVCNLIALVLLVPAIAAWMRALEAGTLRLPRLLLVVFCGSLIAVGLFFGLREINLARKVARVGHVRQLYPPWVTFVRSLAPIAKTSQFSGLRSIFADRAADRQSAIEGARQLGFGDVALPDATSARCVNHPLRQALDAPPHAGMETLAYRAGGELVWPPGQQPIVWHLLMESFRADDIHALHKEAPAAALPIVNQLYQRQRAGYAIPFFHAYGSGVRTAQALGAALCGMGVLPFNGSIVRDFGNLPLRCLPDLLADAGFTTRITYASDLSFDNMLDFMRYHGLETIEQQQLPAGLPVGTWGAVTDHPLLDFALGNVKNAPNDLPRYEVMLTLANHTPFTAPEDATPEMFERARQLIDARPAEYEETMAIDVRRLVTMIASDAALGDFLTKLDNDEALGGRSIVVLHADHATGELMLWGGETVLGLSNVPMVVYLPAPWQKRLDKHAALDELVAAAATSPMTVSDVPSLIVALLHDTNVMKTMPKAARWHTLGGTILRGASPQRSVDITGRILEFEGAMVERTGELNPPFATVDDLEHLGTDMQRVADFVSAFVSGYAVHCSDARSIRAFR